MHLFDFAPLAPLQGLSANWTDILLSHAQAISQNAHMSFFEALQMPISFSSLYHKSQAWSEQKKFVENKFKVQEIIIKQLNNIIKGIGFMLRR
jgi:hypothetical protein